MQFEQQVGRAPDLHDAQGRGIHIGPGGAGRRRKRLELRLIEQQRPVAVISSNHVAVAQPRLRCAVRNGDDREGRKEVS